MTGWSDGYVTGIGYTSGFYRELTPSLLSFASLAAGVRSPKPDDRISYCELGCGQGLSANIHAAANPDIDFYATDFNPGQIASARRLAKETSLNNIKFFEHSFEQLIAEPTLPDKFDIIALHGVYSWISSHNRKHIVTFIREKLRPGGIVYISYNALPGWASIMPLRRLLVEQANAQSGPIDQRIEQSFAFANKMRALDAGYFKSHTLPADRLASMQKMSKSYLAHEYFNKDWTPFYFGEVALELADAKLDFLASAHLLDQVDAVNFTSTETEFLLAESDTVRRQELRDFLINQQFRKDIFVKGTDNYSVQDSLSDWISRRFILSVPLQDISLTLPTRMGEVSLQAEIYQPVLDCLRSGPKEVADLLKNQDIARCGRARLHQALAILVGIGYVQPCLAIKGEKERRKRTNAFNKAILNRAAGASGIAHLASPVTGGGIAVSRFEQLFLNSLLSGAKETDEWAADAWNILQSQGERLQKDGKILENLDENLLEFKRKSKEFGEKKVKILRELQII